MIRLAEIHDFIIPIIFLLLVGSLYQYYLTVIAKKEIVRKKIMERVIVDFKELATKENKDGV